MGHADRPQRPPGCLVETTEPRGFWSAYAVSRMIERGNPTLSADSVSAASVFRADVVRHEIEEGERRNRERGAQAAARLADLLPKAGAR